MKKVLISLLMMFSLVILCACKSEFVPDYANEADFEAALNAGEVLEEKTVSFEVRELKPTSLFGFNIIAGEHLNFVAAKNPGAKVGDTMTVKVTEVESMLGSWIINYELISVDSAE